MKKLVAVLALLTVVGLVFASELTGSVTASYTFDFDKKTIDYGISAKNTKVTIDWITKSSGSAGTNKPYAEVGIDLVLATSIAKDEVAYNGNLDNPVWWTFDNGYKVNYYGQYGGFSAELKKLSIVGEDWSIDFLKAIGVGNYAKSAWEKDTTDDKDPITMNWGFKKAEGITVTYKDYKVGFYAKSADNSTKFNFRAESQELAFAEDSVKVQAAAALGYQKTGEEDPAVDFGVSVKGSYSAGDLSATVSADIQNINTKVDYAASANVTYDFASLDAFYASQIAKVPAHYVSFEKILSVRAVVDVAKLVESVPVKFTVFAENLLNDDKLIGAKEEGTFMNGKLTEEVQFGMWPTVTEDQLGDSYDAFKQTLDMLKGAGTDYSLKMNAMFVNGGVGFEVIDGLKVKANVGLATAKADLNYETVAKVEVKAKQSNFAAKVGAEYTQKDELYKAEGYLYLAKVARSIEVYVNETKDENMSESDDSKMLLSGEIALSSEKLVENATLKAALTFDLSGAIGVYKSTVADFAKVADIVAAATAKTNKLELSCKVAF